MLGEIYTFPSDLRVFMIASMLSSGIYRLCHPHLAPSTLRCTSVSFISVRANAWRRTL